MSKGQRILQVGLIGCGEVAQVIWLPTLSLLNRHYRVKSIYDVSESVVDFGIQRYPSLTRAASPQQIYSDGDIDVVFVLSSDDTHESFARDALAHGKHVLVEKPMTLSVASAHRIVEAERAAPNGARVFVGYMRRYAPSFVQAFKQEMADIPRILYARVRDFPGQNSHFVSQSGIETAKPNGMPQDTGAARDKRLTELYSEASNGAEMTDSRVKMWRYLHTLNSHDMSLMREVLGSPEDVVAVTANDPFYTALLAYKHGDHSFTVTYESGIDQVPRFDAHLTVYGEKKTVSLQYDTPFIKGLPIKVRVDELDKHGQATVREISTSFEDPYTVQAKELYDCVVNGKGIKTSATDAAEDEELFAKMLDKYVQSRAG